MSINAVQLLGTLGKKPVMTTTKNGVPVCNFNLATTERWIDKHTGKPREHTQWHNIIAFGKMAETAIHLDAGNQIFLVGSLYTERYEKDGIVHYITKVKIHEMQSLPVPGQTKTHPKNHHVTPASSGNQNDWSWDDASIVDYLI